MNLKETGSEMFRLDTSGSGWRPVGGTCEPSNKTPVFIKGGEFLDQLRDSAQPGLHYMHLCIYSFTGCNE
jgi:hypothetical protein